MPNALLVETAKIVTGLAPIVPSSSTPDFVSLKLYDHLTIIIMVDNGATVTGSAITLLQATVVAGSDEKALAFDTVYQNIDTAAADALSSGTAVTSNTFTTDTTNNKNLMYVIEVKATDLDMANDFDVVRVGAANAVNAVTSVCYILHPARYAKPVPPTAITD